MNAGGIARRASIMFAALAVGLTACDQAGLDKAGGTDSTPLVLTLANDSSDPAGAQPFATAVRQLSHGALLIKIVGPSARLQDANVGTGFEAPLVRAVQAGRAQLGVTGTQGAFDAIGVTSFLALQAPFLVDSYALQRKVMRSGIARDMLAGLKPAGLVGLGLLPGVFARPFGLTRPLLGISAYRGVTIGAFPALVDDATFRALGAIPQPPTYGGQLAGFETDVETADIISTPPRAVLTGNVILWPWPGVIFMNRRAFDSLTAVQRRDLVRAAAQAIGAPVYFGNDSAYGRDLCRRNKIVNASSADLAALQVAVQPVYRKLEADPSTSAFIGQITSLRAAMGVPSDWVRCTSTQNAPQTTTTANQLDGTWEVTYNEQEFIAAGADQTEIYIQEGNWGHYSLKFSSGHWWLRLIGGDPGVSAAYRSSSGTYVVSGNEITFHRGDHSYLGSDTQVWGPYIWSVYRGTLTFRKAGATPMPTDLVVRPWLKMTT